MPGPCGHSFERLTVKSSVSRPQRRTLAVIAIAALATVAWLPVFTDARSTSPGSSPRAVSGVVQVDGKASPGWTVDFAGSFLSHWFLPFMSLFLVGFGGWAIGMRNMIIYELESDYSQYLASLGAPRRLVRRYAYRNAILPQVTGLALALGAVVGGALVTEVVFTYPGLGTMTLTAIQNRDYFLLQGIFIFIIAGVLIANLIVDIAYVVIDPRTRLGVQGSAS